MTDNEGSIKQDSDDSGIGKSDPLNQAEVERLLNSLSGEQFRDWYDERQYRQNIENGTPYFNGPSSIPEPERHSPSRLLKCHRKAIYQQCNAPEETPNPDGIFWFGTRFEEDIAFPFLERAITGSDTYVQNSVWVDFRVETRGQELHIKGETDPLIVDEDAVPVLPTEIKTKSSVEHTTSPNRSHRAQLHAYMAGLSKKYDANLTDGVILYGSRESLDVKVFHVEFDEEFWEEVVLKWAANHTDYRLKSELPPADPEHEWECKFCAYSERCGKGNTEYQDVGPVGLLPRYTDYPKQKVIEYLEAHDNAQLTPGLAEKYPELETEYEVLSWCCPVCSSSFSRDTVGQKPNLDSVPLCPSCAADDQFVELRIPAPDRQPLNQCSTSP
jgi:CRISPR/Cas system-associated exonuclease Cas4 (RecB family)